MEMIDIHKSALQDIDAIVLHEFKLRYKKNHIQFMDLLKEKMTPVFIEDL